MTAGFRNSGFSDAGFVSLIALELILASAALCVLYARNYALATLYPNPSLPGIGIGVVLYIAASVAAWVLVMPFASSAATQLIRELVTNRSISLEVIVPTAVVNGAYEEVFLLGVLLRGLRGYGTSIALGASLLVRLLYHLYQGPLGAISVLAFGMVLSVYYLRTERLFPVVFAHILADIIPFLWH